MEPGHGRGDWDENDMGVDKPGIVVSKLASGMLQLDNNDMTTEAEALREKEFQAKEMLGRKTAAQGGRDSQTQSYHHHHQGEGQMRVRLRTMFVMILWKDSCGRPFVCWRCQTCPRKQCHGSHVQADHTTKCP